MDAAALVDIFTQRLPQDRCSLFILIGQKICRLTQDAVHQLAPDHHREAFHIHVPAAKIIDDRRLYFLLFRLTVYEPFFFLRKGNVGYFIPRLGPADDVSFTGELVIGLFDGHLADAGPLG